MQTLAFETLIRTSGSTLESPGRFLNLYAWDPSPSYCLKKKKISTRDSDTQPGENTQPGLRITDLEYGESL